jgi:DNA-directed RNA polymerase subunit beta'
VIERVSPMRTPTSPTVALRPSAVSLAELRASGPAAESVASLVVDADVAPDACGLPRSVALAVFWPLVVAEEGDIARIVASRAVTVRRADDDGVPVGLRAHLVDGGAVRVHPVVAAALADGRETHDVAVRGLWGDAAVSDRAAMAPWRMPVDRAPAISAGARLGLWMLTRDGAADDGRVYASDDELTAAWEGGLVAHDAAVRARIDGRRTTTTVGRVWLWRALPAGVRFATVDRAIDAATLTTVLEELCAGLDGEARWRMLAALDDAGSRWLARSGFSVGFDDLRAGDAVTAEATEARRGVGEVLASYADGLITHGERYNKVVDLWARAAARCSSAHEKPPGRDVLGAWRRAALLPTARDASRLVDGHGLVATPSQGVHERPVLGSPARGFDAHDAALLAMTERAEVIRSAARLDDARAVVRSLSGALVKQRVTVDDCGTKRGASVCPWTPEERDRLGASDPPEGRWTAGRVLAEDLRWGDGVLIAAAGTTLDAGALLLLRDARIDSVRLRSPRTCEAAGGVCARCWGLDDTGALPVVGDAVGAKALLTLRRLLGRATVTTFHIC